MGLVVKEGFRYVQTCLSDIGLYLVFICQRKCNKLITFIYIALNHKLQNLSGLHSLHDVLCPQTHDLSEDKNAQQVFVHN